MKMSLIKNIILLHTLMYSIVISASIEEVDINPTTSHNSSSLLYQPTNTRMAIPEKYAAHIKQGLIMDTTYNMRIYYGGPVTNPFFNVNWVSCATFSEANCAHTLKSVYEIAFINCTYEDTQNARYVLFEGNDLDLKFKHGELADALNEVFTSTEKLLLIRHCDVSMTLFPHICIDYLHQHSHKPDMLRILQYFRLSIEDKSTLKLNNLCIERTYTYTHFPHYSVIHTEKVSMNIDNQQYDFNVEIYQLEDTWKLYYIITHKPIDPTQQVLIRIDSGCVSGQIYGDDTCDCDDQMKTFMREMIRSDNALLLHIPMHDGRGFGFAPKAETEIYKLGGEGMIHTTDPIDTVAAARLLYDVQDDGFDLRDYASACTVLKEVLHINLAKIFTDNRLKNKALQDAGIIVERQETKTSKETANHHIKAKHSSSSYFSSEMN